MKALFSATAVAIVLVNSANAQTTSPPPAMPSPSATPSTPSSPSVTAAPSTSTPPAAAPNSAPGAPFAGANSFTQGQAQARIEQLGYTDVNGLEKDADGIWRASATKDGKTQNVSVDFRGNIVVGQK
jgi:hypothetical protein